MTKHFIFIIFLLGCSTTKTNFVQVKRSSVDTDLIRSNIYKVIPDMQGCVTTHDFTQVPLELDFTINPEGRVVKANVWQKDVSLNPIIKHCIEFILKNISYPKSKSGGNVQVHQPVSWYEIKPRY
ncbi:MAG: hypothetical protein ISR65_17065 [Bacteriovoracaceae bacterium]|nr:hypothetical protein [Bacteriovoracaceae bacterium]